MQALASTDIDELRGTLVSASTISAGESSLIDSTAEVSSLSPDSRRESRPTSPKRLSAKGELFPYYAGYSLNFVSDILAGLDLPRGSTVLDPWCGAATTTLAASAAGVSSFGFDLNPTLVVVGKARSARRPASAELWSLFEDLCRSLSRFSSSKVTEDEPLLWWLSPRAAHYFRAAELALRTKTGRGSRLFVRPSLIRVSELVAIGYVGLFRTLRSFLTSFRTSNPTWFKTAKKDHRKRIDLSRQSFVQALERQFREIDQWFECQPAQRRVRKHLDVGNSNRVILKSRSVDAIVASPPYCTRIDYAIATLPELALLGCSAIELQSLRRSLLGSPLTQPVDAVPRRAWGKTCRQFLRSVARHKSKASDTYYSRFFTNYFREFALSLSEIDRVARKHASITLVIQDSYYKGIRADLAQMVVEMSSELGWELWQRHDFQVGGTLAGLRPARAAYRQQASAIESVVLFRRR